MNDLNYMSAEHADREKVYTFLIDCAEYWESTYGEDLFTDALKMDSNEFKSRWERLDKVRKQKLIKRALEGTERFFANLTKNIELTGIAQIAYDTTLPKEDPQIVKKYHEFMQTIKNKFDFSDDM